jgi:hypothetical protein
VGQDGHDGPGREPVGQGIEPGPGLTLFGLGPLLFNAF